MGTFITSTFATTDTTAPRVRPLYARDTFTRANSTKPGATEVGGYAWAAPEGTYHIEGGALASGVTTGLAPADLSINPGQRDGVLTMSPLTLGSGLMAALLFRKASTGNTAFVYYARPQTHTLAIRTGADNFTIIEPTGATPPGFVLGEKMQVELVGDRIICSLNGVVTHDVTNTTYSGNTGVGLTTRATTAESQAKFDDWSFSAR